MRWWMFALSLLPSVTAVAESSLSGGDRVVWLGNTLIEREQASGYWETLLTWRGPAPLTFRNLGWDGDTVSAESRGIFDPPAAGYARMLELTKELKPTVIVLGYGNVEAFSGSSGLTAFKQQYEKLLADLAPLGARLIHLSPIEMEFATFPVQSPSAKEHVERYNEQVQAYGAVIAELAQSRNELFVDFRGAEKQRPWTQNGIHLTEHGYFQTGKILARSLGIDVSQISEEETQGETALNQMRMAIVEKNRLFFHRWRPQNITYLLGFRKHEQGNNAVEIAQFDPLVAELEKTIAQIRSQGER